MKCPECDGAGFFLGLNGFFTVCLHCDGTGEMPMTNDEWRKTCPTEEFAEFLEFIAFDWNKMTSEDILEWLKQPHTVKEQQK